MQRLVQLRLGCHGLPFATGRLAGAGHVDRAHRLCSGCSSGAVGDEKHTIFACCSPWLVEAAACRPFHTWH